MTRLPIAIAMGLAIAAATAANAAIMDGRPAAPPAPLPMGGVFQVTASKTFLLFNPMPFPVQVKIHGDAPGFPDVVLVPAAPAPPVPVPFPNANKMKIKIKKPTGGWSKFYTLSWKSGPIVLPVF